MTAEVLPFPSARRIGQIRRTAHYLSEVGGRVAAGHLRRELVRLRSSLVARRIPPELIEAEVQAYEAALVRAVEAAGTGGQAR